MCIRDSYYPIPETSLRELASIERRLGKPPVLDPRLDDVVAAAAECGLELHLGLYNVGRGWMPLPSRKFIEQVCREELVVARDLAKRYGQSPALKGWYISPEIFYLYHGLLRRLDMHAFLAVSYTHLDVYKRQVKAEMSTLTTQEIAKISGEMSKLKKAEDQ